LGQRTFHELFLVNGLSRFFVITWSGMTVVGIDVGGERKSFHAVALRNGLFVATHKSTKPSTVVDWCLDHTARIVAVDALCIWSQAGLSRRAERELSMNGQIIQCFKTPIRERGWRQGRWFYGWVFNARGFSGYGEARSENSMRGSPASFWVRAAPSRKGRVRRCSIFLETAGQQKPGEHHSRVPDTL
jgi:hypothetical protein